MARLPTPGSDKGQWGNILNEYLTVEHGTDGSLKMRADGTLDSYVLRSRRDHINLLDYLPAGPDGTTDNSAIIRQAVIDAGTGPRRLFIPLQANPWVIASSVLIDVDIEIYSNSWGNAGTPCIQLKAGMNSYGFTFATNRAGGNCVIFRNIEIDGNGSLQSGGGIIQANNAVQSVFDTVPCLRHSAVVPRAARQRAVRAP